MALCPLCWLKILHSRQEVRRLLAGAPRYIYRIVPEDPTAEKSPR